MSRIAVCRLCLATNVKMYSIKNLQVQEVFEKLTSKKLLEKGRPDIMCYFCYSQLNKCDRILSLFRKTEDVFEQLSRSGIEMTNDTISFLKRRNIVNLHNTPVTHIEITPAKVEEHKKADEIVKVPIKVEPMDESVEIKIEAVELDMDYGVLQDVFYEKTDNSTKDSTWDVTTENINRSKPKERANDIRTKDEISPLKNDLPKKSFTCNICDKQFERKHHLRKHTIHEHTEHEENKLKCSECNETFTFKSNMLRHLEIAHTVVKKYRCSVCNKMISRSDHLRNHMRSHSKEKPYACHICKLTFTSSSNVQQHINSIHSNAKPFACDQCHKTFSRKGNLQEHYRLHTGDRPFSCSKCGLDFAYLSNMKNHMTRVHAD